MPYRDGKKAYFFPISLKHEAEHHVDLLEWAIVTFYFHHSMTWNRVDFNLYFTCQNIFFPLVFGTCDILHVCFHNDDYKLSQIYPNRYVNILVKWSCCVTMKTKPKIREIFMHAVHEKVSLWGVVFVKAWLVFIFIYHRYMSLMYGLAFLWQFT